LCATAFCRPRCEAFYGRVGRSPFGRTTEEFGFKRGVDVLGGEAISEVYLPTCVTCCQVNSEQRNQDAVTVQLFKHLGIDRRKVIDRRRTSPLSLLRESIRGHRPNLAEG